MKLVIDIPDEYYKSDFLRNDDRFNDFFTQGIIMKSLDESVIVMAIGKCLR